MSQEQQYARRMARGTILTQLYRLQDMGLNDPATPCTCSRLTLRGLGATGMMPPPELEVSALRWLEDKGYVTVDWAMDDHTNYESVTITRGGMDLYEDKKARAREPGLLLQPRR
ncbi:hypothetical protein [Deinococcus humi]|uniref:ArsR family transcriptional regulator n=1 Tax=Deinococcus humi TaxID=662880 RepID=A0A7W8JW81_9DEIO|nr:hypothetical protein [Deinococcus humi]MBB5363078.1 hypothetical protein [Deinococcus humi]GGO24822.1 hypothetical protein GCM10008949_14080 [Deinococcus humi]